MFSVKYSRFLVHHILIKKINKYGTVQGLCSTVSHIKLINIDFSFEWFVISYVDL